MEKQDLIAVLCHQMGMLSGQSAKEPDSGQLAQLTEAMVKVASLIETLNMSARLDEHQNTTFDASLFFKLR